LLSQAFELRRATSKIYTTTLLAVNAAAICEKKKVLGRYISFQRHHGFIRKKLIASLWYPALAHLRPHGDADLLMTYVVPPVCDL